MISFLRSSVNEPDQRSNSGMNKLPEEGLSAQAGKNECSKANGVSGFWPRQGFVAQSEIRPGKRQYSNDGRAL